MGRWSRMFFGTAEQVAQARQFARAVLDGHPLADSVELVVSELATNSVQHSHSGQWNGPFVLAVDADADRVWVSVVDLGGDKTPALLCSLKGAAVDREHGRGLALVAAVSKEWGTEPVSVGRRVWAKLTPDSAW